MLIGRLSPFAYGIHRLRLVFGAEARCLVEEPGAMLGLVDPILDQTRGGDISVLVTKRMGAS